MRKGSDLGEDTNETKQSSPCPFYSTRSKHVNGSKNSSNSSSNHKIKRSYNKSSNRPTSTFVFCLKKEKVSEQLQHSSSRSNGNKIVS